ncbi:salicylate hydroxylase [Rhodocollybia butyracea]|uniref:Salicylate hydroxylase n=1 Tax=Rhodocollybia butyracea TaxID=206335 RepID=A0A9P5Q5W6_9AGAR|nr:salicylate hydroxylase [Rhodocollybia butyracea]
MPKDFNIAIVGGGLCSLSAAVALTRAGISVSVFEASLFSQEAGAGVGLGPNALRALKGLGIFDAILSRSDQSQPAPRTFRFMSAYEDHEFIFDYETNCADPGALAIYRPAFLDAIADLLDPSVVRYNHKCTSISLSETGKQVLHFADGTTHEADLVIGADGIRSISRRYVLGEHLKSPLVFPNTVAYRGLVPVEDLKRAGVRTELTGRPVCFVGEGKHIICFPIKGFTVINFVVFLSDYDKLAQSELPYPWVETTSEQELKDRCGNWGHDTTIILDLLKSTSKWSIHALDPPLQSYIRNRVVLVGDAAHSMLPHLGSGVGQGFEDVFLLVQLLTHPKSNKANLPHLLAQYDALRPPRANAVLHASWEAGKLYDSYDPTKQADSKSRLQAELVGIWEDVWTYDLTKDVDSAFENLHRLKAFQDE